MTVMQQARELVDRLGRTEALDAVAGPVAQGVAAVAGRPVVKDVLSGTWLGHPLHPLLTDVPIGAWTSAFFLDLLGGDAAAEAADTLIGFGVVTALPTAVAGLSDWSDTIGAERRIGTVHALGNVTAVAFYGLSYLARRRGDRGRGIALSLLGASVATVGAYLGGHLSYRKGVNVDRNAWKHGTDDWVAVGDESALADGEPIVGDAGDDRVMVVRAGDRLTAIGDVCSHAGGPLHEGEIDDGCVTCPWHGSTFRLDDGSVVHGPATGPQPAYDVRVESGKVLVRRTQHPSATG